MAMRSKKRKKFQAFWPVIGLMMAIAFGVMAWFLAPEVDNILARSLPAFRSMTNANGLRIFTTVVLFVIFVLLASLIIAAAVPRKIKTVDERELAKSREAMIKEKKMTHLRRKQMNKLNKGG